MEDIESEMVADWFVGFGYLRSQIGSYRRTCNFKSHDVGLFFDNLAKILSKHGIDTCDVWNHSDNGAKARSSCCPKSVAAIASKPHFLNDPTRDQVELLQAVGCKRRISVIF